MDVLSTQSAYWVDLDDGRVYAAKGEHDSAIACFTAAIRAMEQAIRCPKTGTAPPWWAFCDAHLQRASGHIEKKNDDAAIEDLNVVLNSAKNLVERKAKKLIVAACLQRGILWASHGETIQAIDDFTQVIQFDETLAEAFYRRAIAYQEVGESALAEADFERATDLDPFECLHLRRAFLNTALPKAGRTFPDTRFGQTIEISRIPN